MTATSQEQTRPETSYPTMSHLHGQIRHGTLRPVDGGSTSLNALAFSTLLSSQETDAHRWVSSRFPVGATLKLYPEACFVSTSFPDVFWKISGKPLENFQEAFRKSPRSISGHEKLPSRSGRTRQAPDGRSSVAPRSRPAQCLGRHCT